MLLLTKTTLFNVINIHLFSGNESGTRRVIICISFCTYKSIYTSILDSLVTTIGYLLLLLPFTPSKVYKM